MHLTVPSSEEISASPNESQSRFTVYKIYANGYHHCSLRYSELREFYVELSRIFPQIVSRLPEFPSKKLFSSNSKIINERRIALEQFFHVLGQTHSIVDSSYFNDFFLDAQIKTFGENFSIDENNLKIEIRLLNKHEILIENLSVRTNTNRLFEMCAKKVQINEDFQVCFGLFFYEFENSKMKILRPLCEFESPFLSLKQMKNVHPNCFIVLKKSYWSPDYDSALFEDRRARNLLFIQAQHEIEQSRIFYQSQIHEQLQALVDNGSYKDFILLAQTSRFYGKILINDASVLFPIDQSSTGILTKFSLFVGNREFIFTSKNNEFSMKVTRIRSWKANPKEEPPNIALEYLIKKNKLEWIKVNTEQSILISLSLQSMVKDILDRRAGATMPKMINSLPTEIEPMMKNSNSSLAKTETAPTSFDRLNDNEIFDRAADDDDL